jgi:hypothetical protein
MSSNEFANIFDHAAGIVRIRCHGLSGLEAVIASLRERALSVKTDPRLHRDLFFEPWLDSQQLGVPHDTAEEVARQFHQLSVLKLWTRVTCPDVPAEEDGTIIETASDIEFKEALDRPCPHCGSLHDLVPAIVETPYAPNFPGQAKPQLFDAHRLVVKRPMATATGGVVDQQFARCASIAGVAPTQVQSFVGLLLQALGQNSHLEAVPTPAKAWWDVWKGPLCIIIPFMILIVPVSYLAGPTIVGIVAAVVLIAMWLVLRGEVQVRLAPSSVQRQVTRWGIYISIILFTAGTTGFEFSLEDDNRLTMPLGENRSITLPVKLEWGATNACLICSGTLCFICTLGFVLIYDGKLGWFTSGINQL